MKIHAFVSMVTLCFAAISFAQDDSGLKKTSHPRIIASPGPVTEAEADATFKRVDDLLKAVLHVTVSPRPVHGVSAGSPITKEEVVKELSRLYRAVEPWFSNTPNATKVDYARLVFKTQREKSDLVLLVRTGFIGNYGPLATGKTQALTVQEFGDSLGYFLARLGECTHTSSTKWTPYLHGI